MKAKSPFKNINHDTPTILKEALKLKTIVLREYKDVNTFSATEFVDLFIHIFYTYIHISTGIDHTISIKKDISQVVYINMLLFTELNYKNYHL